MSITVPTYDNFTECYKDLVTEVYENFDYECAPRGMKIREKLAVSFEVKDPRNRLPYLKGRNYSIAYMLGELLWVMAGRNDINWIATYSPFWLGVTDDGSTSSSAPGYRVFRNHPRIDNGSHVQYERIRDELKRDPDSRRAVVYLAMPTDHFASKLDIGCALSTQFFIRGGKLHQVVTMRSSDLILGIPYDLGIFTMLQEVLAFDLGVEVGTYRHTSASLHIYERNFDVAEATIKSETPPTIPPMPRMTSLPDTQKMVEFEGKCRIAETESDLVDLLDSVGTVGVDAYWQDWLRVFVGHRAKKVSPTLKREIYSSFDFEGYRRFKK